jgi:FKBP-type peptidyl-prolyl cis-trans isomerase
MHRFASATILASLFLLAPLAATPASADTPPVMHALPQIRYEVLKSGDPAGPQPTRQDTVRVNYELKLADGTVVDSSYQRGEPAEFPLSKLIPGWQAVVPLMHPGDEWRVLIPAEFGYGAKGKPPVPGGAELDFRIELIAILPPAPPPVAPAPAPSH